MDIGMSILILGGTVILPFILVFSFAAKKLGLNVGFNGPMKMIGGGKGEGEKAKQFDKPPVTNPAEANTPRNNMQPSGNAMYNSNLLPDMRGIDNGNNMPDLSNLAETANVANAGAVGGVGATVAIGLANLIGVVNQSGEVKNRFRARRQIMGNVTQTASMLSNIKLKGPKGLAQNASNIVNNTNRGRINMSQNAPALNNIARGRTSLSQSGNATNLINGNIKRITSNQSHIHTSNLKMRPISKVQSLNVQNFYAKKGLSMKLGRMANGLPVNNSNVKQIENNNNMQKGENIQFNVNDLNVQRSSNYRMVNQQIYAGKNLIENEVEKRKQFDANPKNNILNETEKTKVYNISRYLEQKSVGVPAKQYIKQKNKNEKVLDAVRAVVKVYPGATEQDLLKISQLALEKNKQRDNNRKAIAAQQASMGNNYDSDTRKQIFNENLKGSESASIRMEDWVNKNFSDQINSISEERMQEIRKQAEEYELKSRTISLEDKEAQHARDNGEEIDEVDSSDYYGNISSDQDRERVIQQKMEELTNQEVESNRQSIIESIKDQFIENPDDFRTILGDEFVEKYKTALNGSEAEFERKFVEELAKIDNKEQKDYLDKNPDKKTMNYYEVYKARKQQEFNQDIVQAAGELYNQNGQMAQYQQTLNANLPQPEVNSSNIYINRYAQEQLLNSENG